MSIPTALQEQIQTEVALMDASAMTRAYEEAEHVLAYGAFRAQRSVLSADDMQKMHVAVEYMVRIEGRQQGTGWWYRARRRPQLMHKAMMAARSLVRA